MNLLKTLLEAFAPKAPFIPKQPHVVVHRTATPVGFVRHRTPAGSKRVPVFGTVYEDRSKYPGPKIREITAKKGIHRRRGVK